MAARKSTRVNRKYKTKYRVTNWRRYESGPQEPWRHHGLVLRRGPRSLDTAQERVWPKYSNPLPTDHQNYRPN